LHLWHPTSHPANTHQPLQTGVFRPLKRIETRFVCSGWSAEEH